MMILFVVLSFVMVFILIWQQIQHKKLVREIDYITSRLDTISVISENGFVLIPTDNDSIKKLTTVIICMVLSLWSFIIGMIRKSVPATIVTSLIVIVLRQVIITKNTTNQESIMQVILVAIVTVIATLLIFKRKVPELY